MLTSGLNKLYGFVKGYCLFSKKNTKCWGKCIGSWEGRKRLEMGGRGMLGGGGVGVGIAYKIVGMLQLRDIQQSLRQSNRQRKGRIK